MRFLTVDEVIAASSTRVGGENGPNKKERNLMKFWIWQAEKQIGCFKSSLKDFYIDFIDCVAKKPADHLHTSEIALLDENGNDLVYKHEGYKKRVHPRSLFNNPRTPILYEDAFTFRVDSDFNVDRAQGRYWAYPVDEENNPLIPEEHLEAIMNYVQYNYALHKEQGATMIDMFKREWKIQAAKARGANKMPDVIEAREILNSWMTLVPDSNTLEYSDY